MSHHDFRVDYWLNKGLGVKLRQAAGWELHPMSVEASHRTPFSYLFAFSGAMFMPREQLILAFNEENSGENILLAQEREARETPRTDVAEAPTTVQLSWERNMKLI